MKSLQKALAPLFLSAFFLAGLPSASLAYSLVEIPPQNVTIIDRGEVNCYVKSNGIFQPIGGVIYRTENWIYCKNSFAQTSVTISKIELKNLSKDTATQGVRVEVGGFPLLYEGINAEQSKIFPVEGKIGPNLLNREVAKYYFETSSAGPLKIFVNINGEEKIINFSEVYQWKQEYLSTGSLKFSLVDLDAPSPKIVYSPSEACAQEHGFNTALIGGTCACKDNYMFDSTQQCKPAGEVCTSEYGEGGIPFNYSSCMCAYGYHLENGRHCIVDPKPIKMIPANVKKWSDDNWAHSIPCSSNTSFTPAELKICEEYSIGTYRTKYDWRAETTIAPPAPISIMPAVIPVVITPPVTPQAKPKEVPAKPKAVVAKKPIEQVIAPIPEVVVVPTTIEQTATTAEPVSPPPPPAPTPKQKPLWARVISWFKFWQ